MEFISFTAVSGSEILLRISAIWAITKVPKSADLGDSEILLVGCEKSIKISEETAEKLQLLLSRESPLPYGPS